MMIGDLVRATGTKANTIRFYEESGLMRRPGRTDSGRRVYEPRDLERLRFIRHARSLGFDLPVIRSLIKLADDPEQDCAAVCRIAGEHLETIERKLAQLTALRQELSRIVAECSGGSILSCRILETLSESHR